MNLKGNRKLVALWSCVIAAMVGAIYMDQAVFISFATLLGSGLGIFAYANIKEHENENI